MKYLDLEIYRNTLRKRPSQHDRPRTVSSINREMSCLRHMFKKAVEWDMTDASPFDKGGSLFEKEPDSRVRQQEALTWLLGRL